jgi:isoamylase
MSFNSIPADLSVAWPGRNEPLGVTLTNDGANVAVWAENADAVDLCLFDDAGNERRIRLGEKTFHVFHGFVPGMRTGQRYGFRVHGPWQPEQGMRFNPNKLLVDPYSRAVTGSLQNAPAIHGSDPGDDLTMNGEDSAAYVPMSVAVASDFDWGNDARPMTRWGQTIIYETHVKGFTANHPGVPEALRGTYAGLAHPAAIEHLTGLGVTAVELLPVHEFASETHLLDLGLTNYWGYNSLSYFAPHSAYAAKGTLGEQVNEFKEMVKALHAAGLEVILDVVYNHTCEGNQFGPTLSWRGLDNAGYYRLDADNPRYYTDYTGCGNTLNMVEPHVIRLITDSLRYWVEEMHVDGFRFDLASALARSMHDVDMLGPFMTTIAQDPILRNVKLIAEPWDVGPGGYQVGSFPPMWTEWNGKYRDCLRDFWRSMAGVGELGWRLSGSADLYTSEGRRPYASINFITCHDGFTMRDLVSYNDKHNEANLEGNRDGTNDNRSWNSGAEGDTDDPEIIDLRMRRLRSMLATLVLSSGVPMLNGGDEIGRTQGGNNNAYCQDNDISWFDWNLQPWQEQLRDFTAGVIALRKSHQTFRQRYFFSGRPAEAGQPEDLAWFSPTGTTMNADEWNAGDTRSIGMFISGELKGRNAEGHQLVDDSFLLLFNAGMESVDFTLPGDPYGNFYTVVVDSSTADAVVPRGPIAAGEALPMLPFTVLVLKAERTTTAA